MQDSIQQMKQLDFVKSQLTRYSGERKETGDRVMILCPFHSEKTPSASINVGHQYRPGQFFCFACGAKSSWDEVAPKLGLEPYKPGPPKDQSSLDLFMQRGMERLIENDGFEHSKFRFFDLPKNKMWRGIPTSFLCDLNGRLCYKWSSNYEKWGQTKFIHFPVVINKETHGYFLARLKKDTSDKQLPSYLLAKSTGGFNWSKLYGLWPFDYAIELMHSLKKKTIVLVEGQRDALRLLLNDIPAMCVFGTQSWSQNKGNLLEIAEVNRLILLFDGDCAGKLATSRMISVTEAQFKVTPLELWSMKGSPYRRFSRFEEPSKRAKKEGVNLWDPFNMPQCIVNKIKIDYF